MPEPLGLKGTPMNPISYVNVRQGTCSVPEFSCGNTLPLTAALHGMNHFALETRGTTHTLFYHPTDNFTTGIRLTHMPSPWINDYGHFTFIAASGDGIGARLGKECRSSFTQARSVMMPDRLKVELQLFRCEMELVPTTRGAIVGMTWRDDTVKRFALTHFGKNATIDLSSDRMSICGYTTAHTWETHENFRMYYTIHFDAPIHAEQSVIRQGEGACANLVFDTDRKEITARIATSFISAMQAERNYETELADRSLAELHNACEQAWNERLSLIEIEADEETMRTFYSCLYRMMLFPRIFFEYGADGKPYHYSPDAGKVFEGVFYTDNGFWDTYKTVYPLYSLILPELYTDICRGFCNYYDETGWLPRWMSPGAVNCMPGTAIDAVFGDAAAKKVITDPKLLVRMLDSTMHHVTEVSENPAFGRDGVESFNALGYVTANHRESVNKTQDYAYGNFCIAHIAQQLGKTDLHDELIASSLRYRNLYDRSSGFLRAKDAEGNMRENWSCIQWGADYTEGSAWQNSLAMFHDYGGMAKLMGGLDAMETHLDALFAAKSDYDIYGYGIEIHEMLEMAAVDFGQCAMSNQPSFHIPYLYSCIGRPEKTQYWVRRIMDELFSAEPTGYPGDEDNGSMAGWYVFSALGFYPVCPGAPEYVIGSPAVRSAVLHLGNGKTLSLFAEGQKAGKYFVSQIALNGETVENTYLAHEELIQGGRLTFAMSNTPIHTHYSESQLPYSVER